MKEKFNSWFWLTQNFLSHFKKVYYVRFFILKCKNSNNINQKPIHFFWLIAISKICKSSFFMPHTFIFFACPKKTNQKKGHFFKGIFATQNRNINSKLAPRFRQFLTNLYYYAVEKDLTYLLSRPYIFQEWLKKWIQLKIESKHPKPKWT